LGKNVVDGIRGREKVSFFDRHLGLVRKEARWIGGRNQKRCQREQERWTPYTFWNEMVILVRASHQMLRL